MGLAAARPRRELASTFDVFCVDELARHRQWACEIAERFSGAEVLPVLSTLSLDIDGHVRKAALHASRTVSGRV
jgi:hypothetical protein